MVATTAGLFGRYQIAETPSALLNLHFHDGTTPLKEVDNETPLGVLDQSDLVTQGIHTTRFIPGCKIDATELGSCTANTAVETLAGKLPEAEFLSVCKGLINSTYAEHPTSYTDVVGAERAAIAFYNRCTDQTGDPSTEWPPTDCGSSGPYIISELQRLGVITGAKIATAGESLLSLMQSGIVMMGSPWFYKWMEPDAQGFIDGNGSIAAIEESIRSGVAGGHETSLVAIEKLTLLPTGHVDPINTVIRIRNHWRKSWADNGCCRVHLSTLVAISTACDFRAPVL
jgi:hypothetical protein